MRLLLDTHALLWWLTDDERLSPRARTAILDEANAVFVSVASAWEIATKVRLGKLDTVPSVVQQFDALLAADGFDLLDIKCGHALRAGSLTQAHRDPFDRMLAAQADIESLVLVTRDAAFDQFSCTTYW